MMNYNYDRYEDDFVSIHSEDMDEMKLRMKAILEIVYGNDDLEELEYELEGLAKHFSMKLPSKAFRLTRI